MTEAVFTLDSTVYNQIVMGLIILGSIFSLISLVAAIRSGGKRQLSHTLFTFILTLYALSIRLFLFTESPLHRSVMGPLIGSILFCLTIFFYALHFHFSLTTHSHRSQGLTVLFLVVILLYSVVFILISHLAHGSGTIMSLIGKVDWTKVIIAITALFLLIRLIMAYCYHEAGAPGATFSLLLFVTPLTLSIILSGSIKGAHTTTFTLFSLPLLAAWEFIRLFTTEEKQNKKMPSSPPVGELREQLSQSRHKQDDLNRLLTSREGELGDLIGMAKKVSRKLLPSVIHHDGLWEVTTFFNPAPKSGGGELFDFYYTYGRKLSGLSLFRTPEEPEGALYGALLKKEWTELFNETASLASHYRRIDNHLKEIFGDIDLNGALLKWGEDKIEYTGFGNPPLFYRNGKLQKCAPLIQDKTKRVDEIKSYTLPCQAGDSFLVCNDVFLNKPAPVTGRTFSKEKLPEILESYRGKSADLVRELIDERNKFMGRKDEADILVIYVKRKD
ncbi:MAG: hypothetical protein PQJ60_12510 [Spirochaetales bacterium]|nr:hypothetical protein [Spirochaetales bacterium]